MNRDNLTLLRRLRRVALAGIAVAERDGSGGTSAAFKQIFLIDTAAATDISGISTMLATTTHQESHRLPATCFWIYSTRRLASRALVFPPRSKGSPLDRT